MNNDTPPPTKTFEEISRDFNRVIQASYATVKPDPRSLVYAYEKLLLQHRLFLRGAEVPERTVQEMTKEAQEVLDQWRLNQ